MWVPRSARHGRRRLGVKKDLFIRLGEQTHVVWSSGIMGDEVETGIGIMGMPCTSEWHRWELQCFAD